MNFKEWYYKHGADWNATNIRPVWDAAQAALQPEILSLQSSASKLIKACELKDARIARLEAPHTPERQVLADLINSKGMPQTIEQIREYCDTALKGGA